MIKNLVYVSILVLASGCAKELSSHQYQTYLHDPASGLSKNISVKGAEYSINYWPGAYAEYKGLSSEDLVFFEFKCPDSEVLFTQSEGNFRLSTGKVEQFASIVFAENIGFPNQNRLIIGFARPPESGDMVFSFLNSDHNAIFDTSFKEPDLKRVNKLKL